MASKSDIYRRVQEKNAQQAECKTCGDGGMKNVISRFALIGANGELNRLFAFEMQKRHKFITFFASNQRYLRTFARYYIHSQRAEVWQTQIK